MKVRFYVALLMLAAIFSAEAQDTHFSQFYLSPLTLNPALTGNFSGFYRITGIYRLQWPGIAGGNAAFTTPSLGVDFSLLKDKIKNGALGLGVVFVNDQQNDKTFNTNQILFSAGYNMSLDPQHKFQLGIGLQGGVIMQKVDFTRLTFGDSYDQYLNQQQTQEAFATPKPKGQFNAGIFAKYEFAPGMRVYAGYSINNLTQYKELYLSSTNPDSVYHTPFRHVIHGGFEFDIKDKITLIPGILYQNQADANETNFGLTVGFHIVRDPDPTKRATFYVGLWNRLNTGNYTLIPKIGFEYKGFRAGIAYDAALGSQLGSYQSIGGPYAQAFEIALSYT